MKIYEEKSIEILKETDLYNLGHDDRFEELRLYESALEIVLNLISNLQKENEELRNTIINYQETTGIYFKNGGRKWVDIWLKKK